MTSLMKAAKAVIDAAPWLMERHPIVRVVPKRDKRVVPKRAKDA